MTTQADGVWIRLLAPVPRIEHGGRPVAVSPRAVELLSYLASQQPDRVTSDRLRSRVLGSSEHDAARKTLANLLSECRRALDLAADGRRLVPPAEPGGLYRLSSRVRLDVHELIDRVAEGDAVSPGTERARACFSAALCLIEGEPLTAVRRGFGWWTMEGHAARLGRAALHAARRLVELPPDCPDDLVLARWALAQARRVEPHAQALTELALRVAASSGDVDELRRVWRQWRPDDEPRDPPHLGGRSAPGGSETGAGRPSPDQLYRQLTAVLQQSGQASLAAIEDALRRTVPSAPAAL